MRIWTLVALLALVPAAAAQDGKLGWARSHEIVALWQDVSPNDDIIAEDYAGFVRAVDLDADGIDEIVYYSSSYCTGSTSDCPNGINVLRRRASGKIPRAERRADEWEARAHKTGYIPDAGQQIPGEVMDLQVNGNRIEVTFIVGETSPICLRHQRGADGKDPCPPPGRYTWAYRWTPGTLTRLPDSRYERQVAKAHFPEQFQGKWVLRGDTCEKTGDPNQYLTFTYDRMAGKGEDIRPNAIVLVARSPWTWRILMASAGAPDKEIPAVFILGERQAGLVIADTERVRTFDRCGL